ncbi:MarR family transcriptional regulator [Phenylobacterium sp.]|uniref:MarR family winged helix-turn-helix transcriptional regulator n=1 Tax=Phenylobacterium sp. TaxID=1871053 RepID=UPI00301B7C0C
MGTTGHSVSEKPANRSRKSRQALRLWLRLLTSTRFVEKRIQALMRDQDTTLPRFDALAALSRNPEGVTMGELSRRLLVSNGNVTGIITRLEEEGLVAREPLETDRRTYVTRITPTGEADLQRVLPLHEDLIDSMFSDMTSAEMEVLITLLDKVRASLKRHGA